MKTATRLDDLQVLGCFLQACLHLEFPEMAPIHVQCILKNEVLMILVEHPAGVMPDPQQIFSLVEEALQSEQPEFLLPVKLYLREQGNQRPYTFYTFTVEPTFVETPDGEFLQERTSAEELADLEGIDATNPFTQKLFWDQATPTDSGQEEDQFALSSDPQSFGNEGNNPKSTANPWDQPISGSDLPPDDLPSETEVSVSSGRLPLVPILLAGTGISVAVFFGSFYALTRPCVIGSCQAIPVAQQLLNSSAQSLNQPKSGKEILEVQQELDEAINILKTIPWWSGDYEDAQALLKAYSTQANQLDEILMVLNKAYRASVKSQNPPHGVSEWGEIQKLWREAIADLQQFPQGSNVYYLAQQKLKVYKVNLAIVNKRLNTEQVAQKYLEAGKEGAQVAKARQGVAQSLENWQLVQATWQTSVNRLRQIPQGTKAYPEGQQLLKVYQPQLVAVGNHKNQEQFAANAYQQSLRLAQQARNLQGINQWSQAASSWRSALTYANQIPNGTYYNKKAQPLVSLYTEAIKQSQERMQFATMTQQASRDLSNTCYGQPQICNYTITSNALKVRLTPTYASTVKQTALTAQVKGDYKAKIGLVNHVLTLGEALEAISDNARVPLEVYSPDGVLVQTHTPGI